MSSSSLALPMEGDYTGCAHQGAGTSGLQNSASCNDCTVAYGVLSCTHDLQGNIEISDISEAFHCCFNRNHVRGERAL